MIGCWLGGLSEGCDDVLKSGVGGGEDVGIDEDVDEVGIDEDVDGDVVDKDEDGTSSSSLESSSSIVGFGIGDKDA